MRVNSSHDVWHGNPFAILTAQGRLLDARQHAGRGERGRHGEVQQGEGNSGPLRPPSGPHRHGRQGRCRRHHLARGSLLCSLRLHSGPVLHAYPSVDRLVPSQVVVVLELLVADGTDVLHASRPRRWLHRLWRNQGEEKKKKRNSGSVAAFQVKFTTKRPNSEFCVIFEAKLLHFLAETENYNGVLGTN